MSKERNAEVIEMVEALTTGDFFLYHDKSGMACLVNINHIAEARIDSQNNTFDFKTTLGADQDFQRLHGYDASLLAMILVNRTVDVREELQSSLMSDALARAAKRNA